MCLHKWEKWEQYEEKYQCVSHRMGVIIDPTPRLGIEYRQKRICKKCGKMQDKLIRDSLEW